MWSTRELADLAGTTVNTIRHYHRRNLLAEPERLSNGYKQYRTEHLVRLLRIRRLSELGIPLAQIDVADSPDDTAESLRLIDAELAATIERLQRTRTEIAAVLENRAPADTPTGFGTVADRMSTADRSIVSIYSRLYDEAAQVDISRMIADADEFDDEFAALPDDADEETRQRLAENLAPRLAQHVADYPWLQDPTGRFTHDDEAARKALTQAMSELYTPHQRDVIRRIMAVPARDTE